MTKYFSHVNWASAGERMKDGDVTLCKQREGSVAPFSGSKSRAGCCCLGSLTFINYASRTRSLVCTKTNNLRVNRMNPLDSNRDL